MTSSTFKERYRNHIKSFTHKKYSNETELSKHIWHLKQNKTDFTIKWSIIKKFISYTGRSKRCNLCLEEKLNILKEKDNCLLNKRSEIISACQHKNDDDLTTIEYFKRTLPVYLVHAQVDERYKFVDYQTQNKNSPFRAKALQYYDRRIQ